MGFIAFLVGLLIPSGETEQLWGYSTEWSHWGPTSAAVGVLVCRKEAAMQNKVHLGHSP